VACLHQGNRHTGQRFSGGVSNPPGDRSTQNHAEDDVSRRDARRHADDFSRTVVNLLPIQLYDVSITSRFQVIRTGIDIFESKLAIVSGEHCGSQCIRIASCAVDFLLRIWTQNTQQLHPRAGQWFSRTCAQNGPFEGSLWGRCKYLE
jgi:hypothetical protein